MNKKETKISLIIGILLLLVLISVSTYAYFMVGTTNNFGTKTISGILNNVGNVTLSTGKNLIINLTNEQMLEQTNDVTYYASSTGAKTEETIENIGTAQVVGEGTYNCSYKIKVEDKSTNSMYTTFQSMDNKSEGQIVLTVNGIDYDFNTTNLFPLTIDGIFQKLSQDNPQNIEASFKIVNKKEIDQSALSVSNINLNFTVEEFTCESKTGTDAETLATSGELWQSGLEGDGHRYTGTNPNNYICFGTTDKTTCTGNTDAYMYRIIGVFTDSSGTKYMKLIKKEALNTAYRWNNSNSDVDWGSSTLKTNLNGTLFLTNSTYMPSGWSDRIANWTWNTVNTKTWESSGPDYYDSVSPSNIYLHENNKTGAPSGGVHGTTTGKIGLMYASDYALSLGADAKAMTTGTYTNRAKLKTGWMHLSNNDSGAPSAYEWTISRYGRYSDGYYRAWLVVSGGDVSSIRVVSTYSVRPVFYLNSDEVIKSGAGSLSDPFLLS